MMAEYPEFMIQFRQKAMNDYLKVLNFLNMHKKRIVKEYDLRSDYKQVMTLKDYDPTLFKNYIEENKIKAKVMSLD